MFELILTSMLGLSFFLMQVSKSQYRACADETLLEAATGSKERLAGLKSKTGNVELVVGNYSG